MSELSIADLLTSRVQAAMSAAGCAGTNPNVQPSGRPEHGDYQVNGVMAAAKAQRLNPRNLAQQVVQHLALDGVASRVEVAGPGFINITLAAQYLSDWCAGALGRPNLAVPQAPAQRVVI